MNLQPYPVYRDSGVPWLPKIPEHWKELPIRALTRPKNERGRPDLPLLSVYRDYGVILRDSRDDNYNPRGQDLSAYKVVSPGDLVLNKMKTWQGSLGVSQYAGIVSPAYIVCRLVGDLDRRYLHFVLRSRRYIDHYNRLSFGVRVNQWDMRYQDFKQIPVFFPPLSEQIAIVRFLNHIDRRTRRYIRAQRKLIALLEEQKQTLIQQAVTRGLPSTGSGQATPNVWLKPSGVEWLGEIPEHWKVLPLKRLVSTKITDGPHETPVFVDEGVDFLSAESMVNGRFEFEQRRGFISRELHEAYCRKCSPQRDDIFMCKSGATTGKVAFVETDREFSVWSPLALVRADQHRALPRFLYVALQAQYVQRQVQDSWSYGTQPNLSMRAMERLKIVIPPVSEQGQILLRLEKWLKDLDDTVKDTGRAIDLIREYRTRLIADVVTGKVDVRQAAVHLPEEAEEAEDSEPDEAEADGDEDLDEAGAEADDEDE